MQAAFAARSRWRPSLRLARVVAALAALSCVGATWPALLQPWLPRCLSVLHSPHCCSPGCPVVCRRRLARSAAALAASLKENVAVFTRRTLALGPCERWKSAYREDAERCLRRVASLPLGIIVSQLLRFFVDFFDYVEPFSSELTHFVQYRF